MKWKKKLRNLFKLCGAQLLEWRLLGKIKLFKYHRHCFEKCLQYKKAEVFKKKIHSFEGKKY